MQKAYNGGGGDDGGGGGGGGGPNAIDVSMSHAYHHHGYYNDVNVYNNGTTNAKGYDHPSMMASAYSYNGGCSPMADTTALGNYYHHQASCAIQNSMLGGSNPNDPLGCPGLVNGINDPSGLYDVNGYPGPCALQANGCPPGLGGMHTGPMSLGKQHEIYPWMKESRQNNKQRQTQVTGKYKNYRHYLFIYSFSETILSKVNQESLFNFSLDYDIIHVLYKNN